MWSFAVMSASSNWRIAFCLWSAPGRTYFQDYAEPGWQPKSRDQRLPEPSALRTCACTGSVMGTIQPSYVGARFSIRRKDPYGRILADSSVGLSKTGWRRDSISTEILAIFASSRLFNHYIHICHLVDSPQMLLFAQASREITSTAG
jgi:hypothetical protein